MSCEDWKEIEFGNIYAEPSRNGLTKAKKVRGCGIKFLNMGELFANDRIYPNLNMDFAPISEKEKKLFLLKKYDLLFARQSLIKEGAGKCSIIMNIENDTTYDSHIIRVRLNRCMADPLFYYYYFKSYYGRAKIQSIVEQVTAAGIRGSDLAKLIILYPPLFKQNAIAATLSCLDDKIELNNRINRNLEQIAQKMFDQVLIRECASEPIAELGDIAEINPPRVLRRGKKAIYVEMANLPTQGSFPKNWVARPFSGGMKFTNGDTVIARITPCLENGKTAYINFLDEGAVAFGSTEYIVITSKTGYCNEMFYYLARCPDFVDYAVRNMNGSSGRQRVSSDTIARYKLHIPSPDNVRKFADVAVPIMKIIRRNSFENRSLAALRDTLLPKLISGEIQVPLEE